MKKILKKLFDSTDELIPSTEKKPNRKFIGSTEEELIARIDELEINGYSLPKRLIDLIKNNKWKVPDNKSNLENLVVENCPFKGEIGFLKEMINNFSLFSLDLMKSESEYLIKWLDPKWDKDRVMLFGKKDNAIYPGYIEYDKVILFADFGYGSDTCFALDFRENEESPIVILEYWGDNPQTDNRWKKVANSFEEFEQIIWKEN